MRSKLSESHESTNNSGSANIHEINFLKGTLMQI